MCNMQAQPSIMTSDKAALTGQTVVTTWFSLQLKLICPGVLSSGERDRRSLAEAVSLQLKMSAYSLSCQLTAWLSRGEGNKNGIAINSLQHSA
jgi:hypothetical protein